MEYSSDRDGLLSGDQAAPLAWRRAQAHDFRVLDVATFGQVRARGRLRDAQEVNLLLHLQDLLLLIVEHVSLLLVL